MAVNETFIPRLLDNRSYILPGNNCLFRAQVYIVKIVYQLTQAFLL